MKKLRKNLHSNFFSEHALEKFECGTYMAQEKPTAVALEALSICVQMLLCFFVASKMPYNFYVCFAGCLVAELIMKSTIASASRIIIAIKVINLNRTKLN